MLLRARIVLPVSRPPIEDGAVAISGPRITAVGRWRELKVAARQRPVELGDCVLLPGLINGHCHLDYTDMAGQILPPKDFTDWIKAIVALKSSWSEEDFKRSWRHGAEMLLRTGTTTVADIETVPELLPDIWQATPLRVFSFREIISLKSRSRAREQVEQAAAQISALPGCAGRVGLSPHAPYTTSAELLRLAARTARRHRWRLTVHVAESEAEFLMFMYRQGPMYEWLKSQRDMSDCGLGSPVQHLERCGCLSSRLLAVHVNHLWRDDASLLSRRQVHVVHCPRSHEYFRHLRFPCTELAQARVNICLGTDSLASVRKSGHRLPQLDLFAEMRQFAAQAPAVSPGMILRMVTVHAAAALGRAGDLGELAPGALADLVVIPFARKPAQAYEGILQHTGEVSASMIDGHWAIPPTAIQLR